MKAHAVDDKGQRPGTQRPLPRLAPLPAQRRSPRVHHPGLIVSRKMGEGIEIEVPPSMTPTKIVITALTANTTTMKLGLHAPESVKILRSELVESNAEEKEA